MQHKQLKILCTLALTLALVVVAVPNASAAGYYNFLWDYLNQNSQQPAPEPDPEPTPDPQPTNPQPSEPQNNDFWGQRTERRNAMLSRPNPQPSNPAPQPQPNPEPQPQPDPQPEPPSPAPQPSQLTAREQQMLNLINKDRAAHGLRPLQADMRLTKLARIKSRDIVSNNYFAHQSPTYGSAFDMFRNEGISYLRGGENLSKAGSVQVSHLRLMNSPNHRANLLTAQYTHIGIGIVDNSPSGIVVTQMFIQKP